MGPSEFPKLSPNWDTLALPSNHRLLQTIFWSVDLNIAWLWWLRIKWELKRWESSLISRIPNARLGDKCPSRTMYSEKLRPREACEHLLDQHASPSLQEVLPKHNSKGRQKEANRTAKPNWSTKISHFWEAEIPAPQHPPPQTHLSFALCHELNLCLSWKLKKKVSKKKWFTSQDAYH